jgi:surface antigen
VLAALAHEPDPALDELLGAHAAQIVRQELLRQARRWAAAAAPGRAFEANTVGAAVAALEGHAGPVLFVAPDVPGIDARLAEHALEDLAAGAGIVVGPTNDGTPYLVGTPDLAPERLALLQMSREDLFAVVAGLEGGMGMLRSERRLVTPADARALAADPALALELALPLAAGLDVRARRP